MRDPELVADFVVESLEHLEAIEPLLLEFEKTGSPEADAMNEVFRAIHSIKGAAGFLGLSNIEALAHAMESLLMRLRDGEIPYRPQMADPLLDGTDRLRQLLEGLPGEPGEPVDDLIAAFEILLGGDALAAGNQEIEDTLPTDPYSEQRAQGHEVYALRLPRAKAKKAALLELVQRYGELVAEGQPKKTQAVVSSALDRDLLAEALEVDVDLLEPIPLAGGPVGGTDERPSGEANAAARARAPALLFGDVGVEMGLLSAEQRDRVLEAQKSSEMRRAFGIIAISLGHLNVVQLEEIQKEQTRRLNEHKEKQRKEMESAQPPAQTGSPASDASGAGPGSAEKRIETIRVSVPLLDKLMDLAGELVLGRNQLRQLLEGSELPGIVSGLQSVDVVTTELQESIMFTRMQPIRVLFDRLPRMVRDISRKLEKKVELEAVGGDVEMDRTLIEALADPMTHLLRNSLDHGLEDPAARKALGKPDVGKIVVRAYHERGRVAIEVEDDGRGIDPEKVVNKAVERGAITREQAGGLGPKEAVNLIFHAGLSTAEEVSAVSGRGVGMDVVRSNIQNLGGQIDLDSSVGRGMKVTIHLPLTLAIIPSLITSVAGEYFAIPQVNLIEVVRLRNDEGELEQIRGQEVLRLRGKLLPLLRLDRCLGIDRDTPPARQNVVVLRAGAAEYGLVVDTLVDSEEIVVKPLSSYLSNCASYAGATILGDGRVAMILDAVGLTKTADLRLGQMEEDQLESGEQADQNTDADRRSLLLFKNGAEEQFALPLSEVRRLEKVPAAEIERVGHREYIQHEQHSIPLLRLEELLPVAAPAGEADHVFVLVPRLEGWEAGLVASQIVDTIETDVRPDPAQVSGPGLQGSAILNGKLTLFLDAKSLLEASPVERAA